MTDTNTVEYTLHLGVPDAEPYTNLDYDGLVRAFTEEVRKTITDMGSEGYDPQHMLDLMGIKDYDSDMDEDGTLWQAAATAEIERVTYLFVQDNLKWLTGFAQKGRLPDGITWWVTEEQS